MAAIKPYKTTNDLVETIKRRVSFPISQSTYTFNDVVNTLNEEMMISAVPAVKSAHEEYFVFKVSTPLLQGVSRYDIPYRSVGMALRDVMYTDNAGNIFKLTRTSPDDKAFFQNNNSNHLNSYYLENNSVVLNSDSNVQSGNLVFFIFLRPNLLVRDDRACIVQNFVKSIDITNNSLVSIGDKIAIRINSQSAQVVQFEISAVASSPGLNEFAIGATAADTASNISNTLSTLGVEGITSSSTLASVTLSYNEIATHITTTSDGITIDNDYLCVKFDQLPSTYTDIDTDITENMYVSGSLVDFLQTNPGHKTYAYDVKLVSVMSGAIGKFKVSQLQTYLSNTNSGLLDFVQIKVGDYICLQNECIIPQIPPELHVTLAQQAASSILMSIGDQAGYQASEAKLQQMSNSQTKLIDSRVEGAVPKVFSPFSLLRLGKNGSRRRL